VLPATLRRAAPARHSLLPRRRAKLRRQRAWLTLQNCLRHGGDAALRRGWQTRAAALQAARAAAALLRARALHRGGITLPAVTRQRRCYLRARRWRPAWRLRCTLSRRYRLVACGHVSATISCLLEYFMPERCSNLGQHGYLWRDMSGEQRHAAVRRSPCRRRKGGAASSLRASHQGVVAEGQVWAGRAAAVGRMNGISQPSWTVLRLYSYGKTSTQPLIAPSW